MILILFPKPKGPEPGINTHQGESHQLKFFKKMLRSDLDLPANFLIGGGVLSAKNFLSPKTLIKLKNF